MFLRERHGARPSRTSVGIDGVASCSRLDQDETLEFASDPAITHWTELAVPASTVCPKADVLVAGLALCCALPVVYP